MSLFLNKIDYFWFIGNEYFNFYFYHMLLGFFSAKKNILGATVIGHGLRTLTTLPEDPDLIPRTCMASLNQLVILVPGIQCPHLLHRILYACGHINSHNHIHIHIKICVILKFYSLVVSYMYTKYLVHIYPCWIFLNYGKIHIA